MNDRTETPESKIIRLGNDIRLASDRLVEASGIKRAPHVRFNAYVEEVALLLEDLTKPAVEPSNQTRDDAFARVTQAKLGSFVNASDEFLLALRWQLQAWDAQTGEELGRRAAASAERHDILSEVEVPTTGGAA